MVEFDAANRCSKIHRSIYISRLFWLIHFRLPPHIMANCRTTCSCKSFTSLTHAPTFFFHSISSAVFHRMFFFSFKFTFASHSIFFFPSLTHSHFLPLLLGKLLRIRIWGATQSSYAIEIRSNKPIKIGNWLQQFRTNDNENIEAEEEDNGNDRGRVKSALSGHSCFSLSHYFWRSLPSRCCSRHSYLDVVVIYDEKNENAAPHEIDQNFMVHSNSHHRPPP